jgi:hypothetical protein
VGETWDRESHSQRYVRERLSRVHGRMIRMRGGREPPEKGQKGLISPFIPRCKILYAHV